MGLRTAAAKFGFGFAAATSNKKICSGSRFLFLSRRSIASVAETTADIVEKSSNLYLFFGECKMERCKDSYTHEKNIYKQMNSNLVVRPIRLDGYNDDDHKDEVLLAEEARTFSFSEVDSLNCIIRNGSQILLFADGGRDICWVDLLTRPLKLHTSSPTESIIKSFSTRKSQMTWGFIDRKLYCIQNGFAFPEYEARPIGLPFEVLDPEINDSKWQPLSEPPFIHTTKSYDQRKYYMVLFLNESRKILGWECNENGAFCFDTTKPENGWIDSPSSLADLLPFDVPSHSVHLVINEHHPTIGKFNLLFVYDCIDEPFIVYPYFISDKCDSCQAIEELIRLPKDLCSEYRIGYSDTEPLPVKENGKPYISFDSQIVHLGARKLCLILHKFFVNDSTDDRNRGKGVILVITYEYDIIVDDEIIEDYKPDLKIKTRLLGTRSFKYCLEKNNNANRNDLKAAFVF